MKKKVTFYDCLKKFKISEEFVYKNKKIKIFFEIKTMYYVINWMVSNPATGIKITKILFE